MTQCIFCESDKELNTEFTITLDDGNKVKVKICDKHADEATVKSAKEAFMKKKNMLDELISKAKALGYDLNVSAGGITTVTPPKQAPIVKTAMPSDLDINDTSVVKTSIIDKSRGFQSVGGEANGTMVSSHASHDVSSLSDKLPDSMREGFAQLAVMEGRAGQPITVPHKRVDGTGTTRIIIKKSENDDKLQSRFKKMAQDSMTDNTPDFARAGYQNTTRSCPICKGSGIVIQQKTQNPCPKCNGSGMISIY
jgi:hypothetical protein